MDRDAKVHTYILLEYIKSQGLICYPKILIIVVGWYSTVPGILDLTNNTTISTPNGEVIIEFCNWTRCVLNRQSKCVNSDSLINLESVNHFCNTKSRIDGEYR